MLNQMTLEIIEELGQIPMETIENVAEFQEELKKAGYISYLDSSTDYLIVEKNEELTGKLIFDNGGGLTLQLNNSYAHWYQNIEQAAEDLKTYIEDGNTEGWEGHEESEMELNPQYDQIQNGGYRVYSIYDIISMTKDEYMENSWGNVQDFCIAYHS